MRERWPKEPLKWKRFTVPAESDLSISTSGWHIGPVRVISALEMAEPPDGRGDAIPQWHISISDSGKRPGPKHVRKALRAFGMVGAEEDNHHPGNARHFWLPVDPTRRVDCECKLDEQIIRDPDGYTWTNPYEGACRGCEVAGLTGRACPLHVAESEAP